MIKSPSVVFARRALALVGFIAVITATGCRVDESITAPSVSHGPLLYESPLITGGGGRSDSTAVIPSSTIPDSLKIDLTL